MTQTLPQRRASGRERPGSTYAELSRRVQEAGLLRRRHAYYWTRIAACTVAFVAVWTAVVLVGDSWWQLLIAAVLAVVSTQLGFLGHDAAHRQVFASARWNAWTARALSCGLAGLSYGWWQRKHSKHHGAPNQEGKDPDIAPGVLAFTPAAAEGRTGAAGWFARRQGYLFFPLLLLEGVNLHVAGVLTLFQRRDLEHRRLELGIIAVRLTAYVVVLALVLPPGKAAAFAAVHLGLFGLLLGGSFAPNHKGMPIVPAGAKLDFLRRQVLVSRNVVGGPLTDFAMGGLNYQVEHHLFPSMPRPHLRAAQPIVRRFCREQGIPYTETSLFRSYAIVVRHLNAVGLWAPEPTPCHVVERYRA